MQSAGTYALGHYALDGFLDEGHVPYVPGNEGDEEGQGNRAHADQWLIHRIPKWCTTREMDEVHGIRSQAADADHPPTLHMIDCNTIEGPCIAYADILCDDPSNNFFFMKATTDWSSLFVDMAIRHGEEEEE